MMYEYSPADSGCGNEGDLRGPVVASGLTSHPGYEETLMSHPGYGQTLAPASFCEWVLTPPPGLYVSLTIHNMGNISCHTQLFVYTYLDDNRYPGWNLCPQGYFPLDGTPYHLASARGQWLRVHYRGNKFPDLTTGFSASYGFREPGCSGSRELSGAPWWLASHPGAGSWAVEAGSECTWTLTAPEGQYPALVGGRVDLHCVAGWQTVAVYDGNKQNNNSLIVVLTCTDQVSPLAASGRHLHLMYTDRWASHSLGFNISFRFYPVRQSGCGGDFLLTGTSGELSSFQLQDSDTYTPLSRCRWRLQAPPGVQLVLKFVTFDVTSRYTEGSCSRDIVVLREGGDRSASGVSVYCNGRSAPPPVIMPHHHQLEVFFATESLSNEHRQGKGFRLRYSRTCSPSERATNLVWSSPDENKDGVIIISPGESVLYTCAEGFVATSGDPRRVCGENGTMSGKPIVCLSVRCEDVPSPRFTSHQTLDVNMDGRDVITYKDVLRYACITGYVPTSGDTERSCQADGTLSGHDLVCVVKQCTMYPSLPYSSALPMDSREDGVDVISYGEVIVYTCHHGYQEVRGNSVRKCQEDGTYSGEDLVCAPRVCRLIPVPRGSRVVHQDDANMDGEVHISYMEVVHYSCIPGYSPTGGHDTRVCTATGTLNGTDILCQPNPCTEWPVAGVGTMRKAGKDVNNDGVDLVSYGESLVYSCRPGYTAMTGDTLRVCQDNGTFNGTHLVCVLNTEIKPQRKPSLARPTVIGTAVCLSLLLILLVLVVSLLAARGRRRRSAARSHDTSSRSCDLTFKSPTPHHALTLHRVTTPWDGGGHLGLAAAPETLRRPGMSYIRWPMYLWDDPGTGAATGRHVTLTGQSDSVQGTALPLAC